MAELATRSGNSLTIVCENSSAFVRDLAARMRYLGIMPEITRRSADLADRSAGAHRR
jgi:hypothetical protein